MVVRTVRFLLSSSFAIAVSPCWAQIQELPSYLAKPPMDPLAYLAQAGGDANSASRSGAVTEPSRLASPDRAQAQNGPVAFPMVRNTIEVKADEDAASEALSPTSHVTQQELLSAAGTFGDASRYLQALPGVIWSSEESNEVRVRGGHPLENLFTVDGIEVPNINHFSLSGSNGGFTSMIDSSTIGSMDLHASVYDAGYSSRLSSLVQIQTRQLGESHRAKELTIGISGAGGFYQTNLPHQASLLAAVHRSIISLVTDDVGINGAPVYSDALVRLDWSPSARDSMFLLSLSGTDSIRMNPCPGDALVSSSVDTQYSGGRTTEGLGWNHVFSPHLNASFSATTSLVGQTIGQQYQFGNFPTNDIPTCHPVTVQQVYSEKSLDGLSMLNYRLQADTHGWFLSGGASGRLVTPNEKIEQPLGGPSPFSLQPGWTDAVQMRRQFASGETGAFLQAEGKIGSRWNVLAGLRAETFAILGRHALNPRLSLAYRLNQRQLLHASASLSSQQPPLMDLLSYAENHKLRPVEVRQVSVGMNLMQASWGSLDAEAYLKRYRNEAVSTEYPQLMLSNMIDTLGQWFVWLPLTSGGAESSRGLELTLRTHIHNRARILTTATYSRSRYRALDGVNRRGNYDLPLVVNSMGSLRLSKNWEIEARESFITGRPFTPFDIENSLAQDRGIYDLARINGLREPFYNRVDLEVERKFHIRKGLLDVHAGADNIFDRRNALGIVWLPNCELVPDCINRQAPFETLPQMGLYPAFNARYQF